MSIFTNTLVYVTARYRGTLGIRFIRYTYAGIRCHTSANFGVRRARNKVLSMLKKLGVCRRSDHRLGIRQHMLDIRYTCTRHTFTTLEVGFSYVEIRMKV